MKEVLKYSNCFICGDENPHGLKAKFQFDGEEAISEITATEELEGYRGIFHGGVVSSMLDEVMVKAILAEERYVVTAELTVRYRLPVRVDQKVRFAERVIGQKGRVVFTEGEATGTEGQVFARASAKYVEASAYLKEQLMRSIR